MVALPRQDSAPPITGFDHHSREYRSHWPEISEENVMRCPVARSSAYGGFWLASSYAAIREITQDHVTFSSFHDLTGRRSGYDGVLIPPAVYSSIPMELDPPESLKLRRLLEPTFSVEAATRLEPFVARTTAACLDRYVGTGRIDFVLDLANPVPAMVTMKILGLPLNRWKAFATPVHEIAYRAPGTPGFEQTLGRLHAMMDLLLTVIHARRRIPADDLISRLVTATVDGRHLDNATVQSAVYLILAGGVDTTTALVANTLRWLSDHPHQRQRLIEDPRLVHAATDEFLRFFTPVHALARTVTRDTVLAGQQLRAGDRVLMSLAAANRDPSVFATPGELRLDRCPSRHVAFGRGVHHCPGRHLARMMFRVMLSAVLTRMPDYVVDAASAERYPSIAVTNGYVAMPAAFTPTASGTAATP